MENSTHRALLLPEIVHDILVHADQRTLVHSTSFVNRLFNVETSAVLWRNPFFDVPTVLDSVEDIDRGQHLANRIQSVTLRMNIPNEEQLDSLMRFSYPSLEHLNVVDLERSEEPVNIERLFEKIPNLLSYKDSNPTRATLSMLEHCCPKLTRIDLDERDKMTLDSTLSIFHSHPHLQFISLRTPWLEADQADFLLRNIMQYTNPIELTVGRGPVTIETAKWLSYREGIDKICRLSTKAGFRVMMLLLPAMVSLTDLTIRVFGQFDVVELFWSLATHQKLRRLTLNNVLLESHLQRMVHDSLVLSMIQNLEHLHLEVTSGAASTLPSIFQTRGQSLRSLSLTISYEDQQNGDAHIIQFYKGLAEMIPSGLQKLTIQQPRQSTVNWNELANCVTSLPSLKSLVIHLGWLSRASVVPDTMWRALGSNQLVEHIWLDHARLNIDLWTNINTPLFPELLFLRIDSFSSTSEADGCSHADVVMRHCPNLRALRYNGISEYSTAIRRMISERDARPQCYQIWDEDYT